MKIRDRIKELRRVLARDLVPNQKNWRKHPKRQRQAMRAVLDEIGFADALLAREDAEGRLVLIDGHLRADVAPTATVPVLVLDVTEEEADKILATADPIQGMADIDWTALHKLADGMRFDVPAFGELLSQVTFDDALGTAPETVQRNVEELNKIKAQRRRGNADIVSKTDTEKYLVVVFKSRHEREEALKKLGLPADERYVAAEAIELSVATGGMVRFGTTAARDLQAAAPNRSGAQG